MELDYAFSRESSRASEESVASALAIDSARLYEVTQVHGNAVVLPAGPAQPFRAQSADALVLRRDKSEGAAVGVRVADCVPILVGDLATGDCAAIHAGWRGIVAGVAKAAFAHLGDGPKRAAIGPCIGVCCFEVSRDVGAEIAGATDRGIVHVVSAPDKVKVDLRAAARVQLRSLGLADDDIDDVGGCTRCDAERFHSYRRDGEASGRMLGVILCGDRSPA